MVMGEEQILDITLSGMRAALELNSSKSKRRTFVSASLMATVLLALIFSLTLRLMYYYTYVCVP